MRSSSLGLALLLLTVLSGSARAGGLEIDDVTGRLAASGRTTTEIYEIKDEVGQLVIVRCRKLATTACEVARVGAGGTIVERAAIANVKPARKDASGKALVATWRKAAVRVVGEGAILRRAARVPSSIKIMRPASDKLHAVRLIFKDGRDVSHTLTAPSAAHVLGELYGAMLSDRTLVIVADWTAPAPGAGAPVAADATTEAEPGAPAVQEAAKVTAPAPPRPTVDLPPLAILRLRAS
jgi:hypothetical protein